MPAASLTNRLDKAVAEKDDDIFMRKIGVLDMRWNGTPMAEWPEPLGMFGELWSLHQAVTMEGMWKYLSQSEGEGFHRALDGTREIGAKRAVEYLVAVAKLYPRGRVPADQEKRSAVVDKLEQRAGRTGSRDPLRVLDVEYADAMPALVTALRKWITRNRPRIVTALGRDTAPKGAANASIEEDPFLKRFHARLDAQKRKADIEFAAFREAAAKAGILPWGEKADPRLAKFLAATRRVTAEEWMTVATRTQKAWDRYAASAMRAFDFYTYLRASEAVPKRTFEKAHDRWIGERNSAIKRLPKLPGELKVKGRSFQARMLAAKALERAAMAIVLEDWLHLTSHAKAIRKDAFAPFEGIIERPA